jgi:SsrA-binding protein
VAGARARLLTAIETPVRLSYGHVRRERRLAPAGIGGYHHRPTVAKPRSSSDKTATKLLAQNRKARFIYQIDEILEAGVVLAGSEVKSIRDGKATLLDAFAQVDGGEAWLHQMDIGVYTFAHARNHEPRRKRKLLLHRSEIDRLIGKVREKGYTLVPLSLYEKDGRVKVEIGLAHGKEQHDRREDTKKREAQREIDRAMASRRR